MVCTSERSKPSATRMTDNLHKRFKINLSASAKEKWTLYFQSKQEYEEWKRLFELARKAESSDALGKIALPALDVDWWQSRYGSDTSKGKDGDGGNGMMVRTPTLLVTTPGRVNRPAVMLIVTLPLNLGQVRFNVGEVDERVVSVQRFKERLFEAVHSVLHEYGSETNSSPALPEAFFDSLKAKQDWSFTTQGSSPSTSFSSRKSVQENPEEVLNTSNELSHETKIAIRKYCKNKCDVCRGSLRPLVSRQMFKQEKFLEDGPDYYSFQITRVYRTTQLAGHFQLEKPPMYTNPKMFRGGGVYRDAQESAEDDHLLQGMEFFPPDLMGTGESSSSSTAALSSSQHHKNNAGGLGNNASSQAMSEESSWIDDEALALSSLIGRIAPHRASSSVSDWPSTSSSFENKTTVVHFALRPSREIPVSKFYVSLSRYTKEYDAVSNFSLYVANVRNGTLKWEIRRRFTQFQELDKTLREIDPTLPKLPEQASLKPHLIKKLPTGLHAPSFRKSKKHVVLEENDEIRFMREMDTYLRVAFLERSWDPASAGMLTFVGVLSNGKNELLQNAQTRNRPVMHLDALDEVAEFGDIILFRSVNPMAGIQRRITGGVTFDHIGMVVKRQREGYELLEATGEGVTAYPLVERLAAYSDGFCDLIALRKIRFGRTPELSKKLADYTSQVEGKPYALSFSRLAFSRLRSVSTLPSTRKREYFCSELIAEALRLLGAFTATGRPDSYFLPHFFDEGGASEKFLSDGCAFDDVQFIDCSRPEIKYSKTD